MIPIKTPTARHLNLQR
jgi:hypothetical protein